jgi:hypothetical protein
MRYAQSLFAHTKEYAKNNNKNECANGGIGSCQKKQRLPAGAAIDAVFGLIRLLMLQDVIRL